MSDIKRRLKAAYENVEFYACNPWIDNADPYKKANQVLYVRESKIRDALADEPARPRTVKESIPKSRLAQYSNYEYCESRELCYASSASDISFYYPCICKRAAIKEPWMLPETEQMFLWFSHVPDFNTQQLLQLEELDHLDEKDKAENHKLVHDFHKVSPVFYEIFERTPGKSRYTSGSPVSDSELASLIEPKLKIETPEELILWMKIRSAKVKNLWLDNPEHNLKKDNVSMLKTPIGNYYLSENTDQQNFQCRKQNTAIVQTVTDYHMKNEDFRQLQILVDSIRMLEDLLFNWTRQMSVASVSMHRCKVCEVQEDAPKIEAVPVRRLYSAVLQGLQSDKKQPSYTPTPVASSREHLISVPGISSVKSTTSVNLKGEGLKTQVPPVCISVTQTSARDTNHASLKGPHQEPTKPKTHFNVTLPMHQKPETQNASSRSTNHTTNSSNYLNYINSTPNIPCSQTNSTNLPSCSLSSPYMSNTNQNNPIYFSTNTCNNRNCINSSTYFNSQYSTSFQNSSYVNTNFVNTLQGTSPNQISQVSSVSSRNTFSQFNRQAGATNHPHMSSPHSMWFLSPNKTSGIYTTAYFATQPCLVLPSSTAAPQSPIPPHSSTPNHRWTPVTHFMRPPALQPCHAPSTAHHPLTSIHQSVWEMQNQSLYRTSSIQQTAPSSQQFSDNLNARAKPRSKRGSTDAPHFGFTSHKETERPEDSDGYLPHAHAKRSTSSDAAFLPAPKPLTVKPDSSTSSLGSRKMSTCRYCRDAMVFNVEKRRSVGALNGQNANLTFFSTESDECHLVLPVTETASDVLEREAVEQYQHSEENIYVELERQAEEQYNDDDHLENMKSHSERQLGFRKAYGL